LQVGFIHFRRQFKNKFIMWTDNSGARGQSYTNNFTAVNYGRSEASCSVLFKHSFMAGKSYWRGRLSRVYLLAPTSLDRLHVQMKISLTFFKEQATSIRRSTVLSLASQLVFPCSWVVQAFMQTYLALLYVSCLKCFSID
jgi:hypothetical protein